MFRQQNHLFDGPTHLSFHPVWTLKLLVPDKVGKVGNYICILMLSSRDKQNK